MELERRRKKNPRYSLRAFAKSIGVDNDRLSRMIQGKRPTPPELVTEMGARLGLNSNEIEVFRSVASARQSLSTTRKRAKKATYVSLAQDVFESIEDWRHYAILELMKLRDFTNTPHWVATVMEIPVEEAISYIDRLQRVGLLEISKDGTWVDTSAGASSVVLNDFETTDALRRVQKSFLALASSALEKTSIEHRDHSAIMMSTHSSRVAGAKKMINRFRRELCAFLEECEEKDSVYALTMALFPLISQSKGSS
jgi:uncharacterized protein (TIGR02147 family)